MGGKRIGISGISGRLGCRRRLLVLCAAAVLLVAPGRPDNASDSQAPLIGGPYGRLLAHSADLGPARDGTAEVIVALHDATRPQALIGWAGRQGLSVWWRTGQNWAAVDAAPDKLATAFGVAVHNYRTGEGQVFYAAARQPKVPLPVGGEVTDVGRILGYGRHRVAKPPILPRDVPGHGLTPGDISAAYNTSPLAATGNGQTVAFFEWGDYDTTDLDLYARHFKLPPFKLATPIGDMPPRNGATGETELDLEAVHAVAPNAQLVVVNANHFFPSDGNFSWTQAASMFNAVDQQFPGAVWSSSIGVAACDRMLKGIDPQPARSALAAAEAHGTSAFDASGDTGGLECKESLDGHWGTRPTPDDIGLDSMASLPEMTDVGGTTLTTDAHGAWLAEATWVDYAMQQGTGGGVSATLPRPAWQSTLSVSQDSQDPKHRLTPDVAAVADPNTGMLVVYNKQLVPIGGTSLAAPLWAGMASLMNEYLKANGGHPLGALNPLLYQVAATGARPAFHDVTLAGNIVYVAGTGYDLVSGLGSPNLDNLVHDILDIQRAGG